MARLNNKADQRLHLLVGFVVLLGATVVMVALASVVGTGDPDGSRLPWAALIALVPLVTVGNLLEVRVRVRSTMHGVAWTETAILVCLVVLPLPTAVLATTAGIVLDRKSVV